ncbi:MAG: hypothetical protein WD042_19575 [Phycisphaeraceae bacterium]
MPDPASSLATASATPPLPLHAWSRQLQQIAQQPLALRPDFPQIARRYEAWWHHDVLDRPILQLRRNRNPSREITRRCELLDDPTAWLAAKRADAEQHEYLADALPVVRVDFGPVLLGGLLGGRMEFEPHTSWTHPYIDEDWSNAPTGAIADDNPYWVKLRLLLDLAAAAAPGQFLVATPDLGGSADVLLNLRGPSDLCLDAIERPQTVARTIHDIYAAWQRAFALLYDRVVSAHGAGVVHWLELWSDRPYGVPACDFNYLIGPHEFESLCLPDIARQAAAAGRAVFHLDGPGAARHIDALLDVPQLDAIQFTPGAGTPSTLPWIDMFRQVQQRGKSLLVFTPADEVLTLARELNPRGLAINAHSADDPAALAEAFGRQYGCTA